MILDTNAISDLAAGQAGLLKLLRASKTHSIPTVVLGEFRYALARSRSKVELSKWVAKLETQMEILSITKNTAHFYAEIRNELRDSGQPIPENDVWIAALAREHRLAVLSQDSHFDYVVGLVRLGW